jgi:hypothetical protein
VHRGFVKLWRKALDSGWLRKHKLWVFWTYCMMKATHKSRAARVGNQEIVLNPGQFIFGRRVATEETGLTDREIRTCLDLVRKWQNVTIKATNKFSIITIVNWNIYQANESENDQLCDQEPTNRRPHTRTKEHKNIRTSSEISAEIASLSRIYSPGLLDQVFLAISSTRKSNSIADAVRLKILQSWQKYPVHQVEAGIGLYLGKGYAAQGKREAYLLGIIRNHNGEPPRGTSDAADPLVMKSSGSPTLDEHYLRQGYRIQS